MKDIDFDELDKAVSSALGKKQDQTTVPQAEPSQDVSSPAPEVETMTNDTASSNAVEDRDSQPLQAAADRVSEPVAEISIEPVAPVQAKSPALKRSSGRFMDVVHPSSDMKSTTGVNSLPSQPQRMNIKPISSVPPAAQTESQISEPLVSAGEQIEDTDASTGSPFIKTDVEKRPLNAGYGEEQIVNQPEEPQPETVQEERNLMPDISEIQGNDQEAALVPELGSDIVAVESAEATGFNESNENTEQTHPETTENSQEDLHEQPVETVDTSTQEQSSADQGVQYKPDENTAGTPVFTTSIQQQYAVSESTSDNAEHNIFDTQLYHQPLVAAQSGAHKKSHLALYIIGFFVLFLAIGAVLGYFVFTYVS